MTSTIDIDELEKKILYLLEHDQNFRRMVMDYLELEGILERLDNIEKILKRHNEILSKISDILEEHMGQLVELRRLQEIMKVELSALTESFYAKVFLDDLLTREEIIRKYRNYRIDDLDIDLLVETTNKVYIVEVMVKPKIRHVGDLIVKRDLVSRRYPGKEVVAVLAGAYIGDDVEEYARSKGIVVCRY